MILGLGVITANTLCPWMMNHYRVGEVVDFRSLFLIAAGVSLAATVSLALFFHPPAIKTPAPT
jgi:hypothetical protein